MLNGEKIALSQKIIIMVQFKALIIYFKICLFPTGDCDLLHSYLERWPLMHILMHERCSLWGTLAFRILLDTNKSGNEIMTLYHLSHRE